jgi:hypothetical protein
MERRKCLVKFLKNELWNFTVDTHAYCTHFIIDRSINVSLRTGCRTWRFVDRHVTRFWPRTIRGAGNNMKRRGQPFKKGTYSWALLFYFFLGGGQCSLTFYCITDISLLVANTVRGRPFNFWGGRGGDLESLCASCFFLSQHHVRFFLPLSLSQHFFFNSLYYLDSLII